MHLYVIQSYDLYVRTNNILWKPRPTERAGMIAKMQFTTEVLEETRSHKLKILYRSVRIFPSFFLLLIIDY
jgi:hypothetical protein